MNAKLIMIRWNGQLSIVCDCQNEAQFPMTSANATHVHAACRHENRTFAPLRTNAIIPEIRWVSASDVTTEIRPKTKSNGFTASPSNCRGHLTLRWRCSLSKSRNSVPHYVHHLTRGR